MKAQKGTLTAHGTPGWHSLVFCGLWFMGSVAVQARANHLPSEQGGPSGEGPSSSATSVPPATAGRNGAGELPKSPLEYPVYGSVMTMYKTYYSIVKAAVSVAAPNEAPEVDEEQEESSHYKCALCKQFKDNPNP
ncbi:hypothetical protein Celaphus_00009594 [Cervus elaphus hippelaphus]|uniref:Uncharacterized protein n=1 Tax=Cervus elaphus hippelaphus TaxID=46360 RepID=A0A212BZG9_CEREH|nr:hypothetical protein Celaphus_00009594 [Cervus elaphus hippelaphus]